MQKAILVKDLDSGTESYESFPDFQRKEGGHKRHMEHLQALHTSIDNAQDMAAVKLVLHSIIRFMEKS